MYMKDIENILIVIINVIYVMRTVPLFPFDMLGDQIAVVILKCDFRFGRLV